MEEDGEYSANVGYVSKSSKSLEDLVENFLSTKDVTLSEELSEACTVKTNYTTITLKQSIFFIS